MSFSLHEDTLRRFFSQYREHKNESLNKTRDLATAITVHLLRAGTVVVMDQLLVSEEKFMEEIEALKKEMGISYTRIVLKTSEQTSLERVGKRGYESGGLLDEKRVSELWHMMQKDLASYTDAFTIDTDNLSAEEVFKKAEEHIGL